MLVRDLGLSPIHVVSFYCGPLLTVPTNLSSPYYSRECLLISMEKFLETRFLFVCIPLVVTTLGSTFEWNPFLWSLWCNCVDTFRTVLPFRTSGRTKIFPADSRLLISFRLSSNAEILLVSTDWAYELAPNVQKHVCNAYTKVYSKWASILRTNVGGWLFSERPEKYDISDDMHAQEKKNKFVDVPPPSSCHSTNYPDDVVVMSQGRRIGEDFFFLFFFCWPSCGDVHAL